MLLPLCTTLLTLLPHLTHATALPPRALLPTGQTVKQDVLNIHNAVLELDATIQSFQGSPLPTSLIEGTPVLFGVGKIHTVNRIGYAHALAALPFSEEDSVDVVDAVVDTGKYFISHISYSTFHIPFPTNAPFPSLIHPKTQTLKSLSAVHIPCSASHPNTHHPVNISIPTSIAHLKAKASAFKEGGLIITVIASLKLLLHDHDSFSAAVLAKMSPEVPVEKRAEGEEAVANIHDAIERGIVYFEGMLG